MHNSLLFYPPIPQVKAYYQSLNVPEIEKNIALHKKISTVLDRIFNVFPNFFGIDLKECVLVHKFIFIEHPTVKIRNYKTFLENQNFLVPSCNIPEKSVLLDKLDLIKAQQLRVKLPIPIKPIAQDRTDQGICLGMTLHFISRYLKFIADNSDPQYAGIEAALKFIDGGSKKASALQHIYQSMTHFSILSFIDYNFLIKTSLSLYENGEAYNEKFNEKVKNYGSLDNLTNCVLQQGTKQIFTSDEFVEIFTPIFQMLVLKRARQLNYIFDHIFLRVGFQITLIKELIPLVDLELDYYKVIFNESDLNECSLDPGIYQINFSDVKFHHSIALINHENFKGLFDPNFGLIKIEAQNAITFLIKYLSNYNGNFFEEKKSHLILTKFKKSSS